MNIVNPHILNHNWNDYTPESQRELQDSLKKEFHSKKPIYKWGKDSIEDFEEIYKKAVDSLRMLIVSNNSDKFMLNHSSWSRYTVEQYHPIKCDAIELILEIEEVIENISENYKSEDLRYNSTEYTSLKKRRIDLCNEKILSKEYEKIIDKVVEETKSLLEEHNPEKTKRAKKYKRDKDKKNKNERGKYKNKKYKYRENKYEESNYKEIKYSDWDKKKENKKWGKRWRKKKKNKD